MAIREVLLYPNPVLRELSAEVSAFDKTLKSEITDLVDTLRANPGVAIAAPQIGIMKRIIALDITARGAKDTGHGLLVLINPVITARSHNKIVREGCLSIPDYLANVKRAKKVTATALDRSGKAVTIEARGLEAIALQHEIDHLDGILFIDRVASVRDLLRRGELVG
jgi:peptide deformylase